MNGFWLDLRLAARRLRSSPAFTAMMIAVLSLGVGGCLIVWAWADHLVYRPFPGVPDQQELRFVGTLTDDGELISLSTPDVRDLATGMASELAFSAVELQAVSLRDGNAVERAWAGIVAGNYFDALGVPATLGRVLGAADDRGPGERPVAVLSYRYWQRRFAGDPGMLGRQLTLNGHSFTVVGVAAREFRGTEGALGLDLWVPVSMQDWISPNGGLATDRGSRWLRGLARLRPGVSGAAAEAALAAFSERYAAAWPATHAHTRFRLFKVYDVPWGAPNFVKPIVRLLGVMVGLFLVAACANGAQLLLVRSLARRRETSIRLALGAGRRRLLRELALESMLLATAATAAGILVAEWGKRAFFALMPPVPFPIASEISFGVSDLAAAILLTFVVALVFGLAPALTATRVPLSTALREEASAVTPGRGRRRWQWFFVALQTGLAALLLIVAALFARSVIEGHRIDPGFDGGRQLLASIDLFPNGYTPERGIAFYETAISRLEALPGVESVALARRLALDLGGSSSNYLTIDGYAPAPNEEILVTYNAVSAGYLRTLGGRLVSGREFGPSDRSDSQPVAVVSQAMARRYWPRGDALGGHFRMSGVDRTVVGVSADMAYKDDDLGAAPRPFFFVPLTQAFRPQVTVHIRTTADPLALAPAVRRLFAELDPDLPLYAIKSLDEHMGIALFRQRLAATLLGAFGAVSLLLATVGLYGLISLTLRQRQRELAVRTALGAAPRDLARLLVSQGARAVAAGLAGGMVAAAVLVSLLLRSLLLGVTPFDPLPWLLAVSALAAAAVGASWLPARLASRVDAASVLRGE